MIFEVKFTLTEPRKKRIYSKYRTTWTSINKPEHSSASLCFDIIPYIDVGESCDNCALRPVAPELWKNIKIGENIICFEGLVEVGNAVVKSIITDKTIYPSVTFSNAAEAAQYSKQMKFLGFEEIQKDPTLNINDVLKRRYKVQK